MSRVDFNTKKLADKVNKKFSVFVRKVVLDGMKQLIRQSPVDTGRFRAAWSTSISKNNFETTTNIISNITKQSKGISAYKLGQTMYLYNNLEYAMPLEFGTSQQAPKGWVRQTAKQMQKKLDEVKNIL